LFFALDQIFRREKVTKIERRIEKAKRKNKRLIDDLSKKRDNFCDLGTRKVKLRLNKIIAQGNPVAQAVRIAIEIEDKSVCAKKYFGKWRRKIYETKHKLIIELRDLFVKEGWVFGVHKTTEQPPTTHVIYFEIPGCEQISFHFSPSKEEDGEFPNYNGVWDKKPNSTLGKLEVVARDLILKNFRGY
jgi:hypothetical protein